MASEILVGIGIGMLALPAGIILTWLHCVKRGERRLDQETARLHVRHEAATKEYQRQNSDLLDRLMAATQSNLREFLVARDQSRSLEREEPAQEPQESEDEEWSPSASVVTDVDLDAKGVPKEHKELLETLGRIGQATN